MNYYIGQALGILSTLCCLVMPLWKKKQQMLIFSCAANVTAALNLVLIGEVASGFYINILATIQVCVAMWHVLKHRPVTRMENIVFFIAYLGVGLLGYKKPVDILAVIGVLIYMFVSFQRDEQRSRWFIFANSAVFMVYYILVGSTVVFAELMALLSSAIGLWKYRKKA